MKALLPISLIAAFVVAPAFADCVVPAHDIKMPDGSKATKEEMLATQHAIKEGNAAVIAYGDCLKAEQDAKIAAGGEQMKEDDKVKINTEYANRQNAQVEKLQKLADKFNVELRAYKAKMAPPAQQPQ